MSAPACFLADANIFLRFLRNDHPAHADAARKLLAAAARGTVLLRIPELVVADTFYTLTAPRMGVPRPLAARQLAALLQQPGLDLPDRARILETLGLCETRNIDYGDAALIVQATREHLAILSFDQDFANVPGLEALTPIDWLQTS